MYRSGKCMMVWYGKCTDMLITVGLDDIYVLIFMWGKV